MLDAAPVDEREARLLACLETLEAIIEDRGLLAGLEDAARERLVIAAGRVSCPDRHELRKLRKARRLAPAPPVRERAPQSDAARVSL